MPRCWPARALQRPRGGRVGGRPRGAQTTRSRACARTRRGRPVDLVGGPPGRLQQRHLVLGCVVAARNGRGRPDVVRIRSPARTESAGADRADHVRALRGLVVSVDRLGPVARRRTPGQQPRAAVFPVFAAMLLLPWSAGGAPCPGRLRRGRSDGDRSAVPPRLRRPRHEPVRRSTGRAHRLLQLDRRAVHDRGARAAIALAARRELPGPFAGCCSRLRAPGCSSASSSRAADGCSRCR